MKNRIFALDLVRGIGVLGVVIFHRFLFDYELTFNVSQGLEVPLYVTVLFSLFGIFLSMAGLFFLNSGIVNTITFYKRCCEPVDSLVSLSTEKSNSFRPYNPKTVVIGAFLSGFFLIILHIFYEFFFAPSFHNPIPPDNYIWYGFITRAITRQELSWKTFDQYLRTTTLLMIGITIIFVTIINTLLFRKNGVKKFRRNLMILGGMVIFFLIGSIFLRAPLYQLLEQQIEEKHYFHSILLAILVRNQAPIFPYLAYGLIGSMLGLLLIKQVEIKRIQCILLISGISGIIIGSFSFMVSTGLNPSELTGYTPDQALQYGLLRFQELGMFAIILLILFRFIDYNKDEQKKMKRISHTTSIRRFGMLSLTVYTLEPLLAAIYRVLFSWIYPAWTEQLGPILIYIVIIVFTWHFILLFWEKFGFVGSFEWTIVWILSRLAGKRSNRLNLKYLEIRNPKNFDELEPIELLSKSFPKE